MYIFFDLDGTLLDTLPDICSSVNAALKLHDLKPITLEETKCFIGHGSTNLIKKATKGNFNEKILKDYLNIYHNNLCNLSKIYPNVRETLIKLKENHVLGVYSNKDESDVIKIINHYLPNIFKYIIGKNIKYPLKPNPNLMNDLIAKEKINKKDLVYIGDMKTDYDLALNLGVDFIFASYGYSEDKIATNKEISDFINLCKLFD